MTRLKLETLGNRKIHIDPLPIMGSEAFLIFIYEFQRYLQDQGIGLAVVISNSYSKEAKKDFYGEFQLGIIPKIEKNDVYTIAEGVGYAINPDHKNQSVDATTFTDFHPDQVSTLEGKIDQLALCQLSRNFIFTWLMPQQGRTYADFFQWLKKQSQYHKPDDLVRRMSRMLYQRSALVSRSFLGGYYL